MYFESRMHSAINVADAAEAVRLINTGKASGAYHVPVWRNKNGHRIALVDDSHINRAWQEVAVVNLDTKEQYESLTFAWMKTEAEKLNYVMKAENGDTVCSTNVTVAIDGENADTTASFECSCCGESFESTIAKQKGYDQDAGYGYCLDCIKYIAGVTS